ncbi:MAG: hypothetical protein M1838_003395, partial [Thelocarpon superellum]
MPSVRQLLLFATATCVAAASSFSYTMKDDYQPQNFDHFFSMFDFNSQPDKSNGYVKYLDQTTAEQKALIGRVGGSAVYVGVDNETAWTYPDPLITGRSSVRIESKNAYTHGLFIADIAHMPGDACGAWPGFWLYGPEWPSNGEIDILENVNNAIQNKMSLHAGGQCCGTFDYRTTSFGRGFNENGGGVYALEWTSEAFAIWFWPNGTAPHNVFSDTPDPSQWYQPTGNFSAGSGCKVDEEFKNNRIVFNTDFCGDWAKSVWESSGCQSSTGTTCEAFVAANPSIFSLSYWTIRSLRVFQAQGDT